MGKLGIIELDLNGLVDNSSMQVIRYSYGTASGFRAPLATVLFYLSLKVLVSPALCQIDCGLSSLLMLQCEENTPSPGSLAASPRL
ncbi:hypothetical protein ROHU_029900 [Labeo rohita]|uniref:Uncharacterized protein n=1 Tax=Labeo rohita TaxID=84645 RepID=A0A498LUA1_LABRO|nr:hypothetical protein ROHU_029900 [Labeo rohita]